MSSPITSLGAQGSASPLGVAPTNRQLPSATSAGTSLTGLGSTPAAAATPASSQDVTGTDTFLKLLVAQLRNQDPSSPMDNQAFITEMAQFNTVEQLLNVKQAVTAEMGTQQAVEGVSLLGKTVSYTATPLNGGPATIAQGVVNGVNVSQNQVILEIGTQPVPLSEVTAVS